MGNFATKDNERRYLSRAVSRNIPELRDGAIRTMVRRALLIGSIAGVTTIATIAVLALHTSQMTQVKAAHGQSEDLASKIRRAQTEAAAGRPQPLSLNEAEINSYLASGLASSHRAAGSSEGGVQGVSVHMVDNKLNIHVLANFYGQDMTLDIKGRLNTRDGYMRFVPLSGSVGALPIPASVLRAVVDQAMSSPQAQRNMRLPATVSDLSVEAGQLVVHYK
jgi:hypothetical protein